MKKIEKIAIIWCSINFMFFGFLKFTHTHFNGIELKDLLKDYNLCTLTFFFFSASVGYTTILGIFQFLSGLALMFNKVRVFALFTYISIQLNICLLNIFYSFGYLITIYNLILLTILFLLSIKYVRKIYIITNNRE